ncbi:MAG: sigma 54-interacting transcriptional regulator [Firmicutes bacterium]|nr:sigma 54-interacting transcriptional regulator [Bacillota bacterium]
MFRFDVQLQEISQNLKTIIDNISEGIHVIDGDGRLVFINDVARGLFHTENSDMAGKHITEVFAGSPSRSEALLEAMRTGRVVVEREETFTRDDGGILTVASINVPVKLGSRIIGAVKISRDDAVVAELTRRIVDLQTRLYEYRAAGTSRGAEAVEASAGANENETRMKWESPSASSPAGVEEIVGVSEPIIRLKHILQEIAGVDEPVLLYGEPGVGQELVAKVIHVQSNQTRRRGPFICQSIRAIPGSMVEALLFGASSSPGTVETGRDGAGGGEGGQGWRSIIGLADGGTLFLRDIDAMPGELLARLITVAREGRVFRAGSAGPERVDIRFIFGISTTGESLPPALAGVAGTISVFIPPLRDRKEDIPNLVAHFISEFNNRFGKHCMGISGAVSAVLQDYDWPGNVRELKCAIEQAMILLEDDWIRLEHLPPNLQHVARELGPRLSESERPLALETGLLALSKSGLPVSNKPEVSTNKPTGSNRLARPLRHALENLEIEMVNEAMKRAGGNISRAARLLGIPRQTLQYRLKKYNTIS